MAVISNTVQGLNETIGLLKQILIAINDKDKKNKNDDEKVQAKDISSSAIILSKIDKKSSDNIKNVILAFEPLNKMGEKISEKVKNISESIKILADKEIITGLKLYGKISAKEINNVNVVISSLIMNFNEISKKIDLEKILSLTEVLKKISENIKILIKIIINIGLLLIVSSLIGVLAIFAWKYILTGFATITATLVLLMGISYLIKKFAVIKDEIINSINSVINIMISLSLISVVSAMVGLLSTFVYKYILIGFATITSILFGIMIVVGIVSLVVSSVKLVTGKLSWLKIVNTNDIIMPDSIKSLLMIIISISFICIVSLAVGLLANKYFNTIMEGLGVVTLISLSLLVILGIVSAINKNLDNAMKALLGISAVLVSITFVMLALIGLNVLMRVSNVTWTDLFTMIGAMALIMLGTSVLIYIIKNIANSTDGASKTVISIAILLIAITFVMLALIGLNVLMRVSNVTWTDLFTMIGAMGSIMLATGILIAIINKVNVNIKTIIIVALMIGLLLTLTYMMKSVINITKDAMAIGWGEILITLGSMAGVITAVGLLILGIGTLIMNPIVAISIGMGAIFVLTVAEIIKSIAVAIREIIKTYEVAKEIGIDNIAPIGEKLGSSIGLFVKNFHANIKDLDKKELKDLGKKMKPISKMINTVSTFLEMLSGYSTDDCSEDELRPVHYNALKGTYEIGKKINLIKSSKSISYAFGKFVNILSTEFEDIERKEINKLKRISEANVVAIVDSCSKYIEVLSQLAGAETTGAGENKNGILYIFERDANGNFIKDANGSYKKRSINLKSMGEGIAFGMTSFISSLADGLAGVDYNKNKMNNFADNFSKISNSFNDVTSKIFSIDDSKAKKLQEYTEAINNFAEAVGKVAESIDKLNEKQIDSLKFEELRKSLNMNIGNENYNNVGSSVNNLNENIKNQEYVNSNKTVKNESINKEQNNIFDTESISNAIVEGFKKINILKVELNKNGAETINMDGIVSIG